MKHLLLAILGMVVAWLIIGFFTNNWNPDGLLILIIGFAGGYAVRKQAEGKDKNQ